MARKKSLKPLLERFWSKISVKEASDCWEWQASKGKEGYGQFKLKDSFDGPGKTVAAHRFAWELVNGPIPEELCVLHRCDNPPCCNSAHLFLGTKGDNSRDRDSKGRQAKGEVISGRQRGSRNRQAKLTDRRVRTMRAFYERRILNQKQLADFYGVDNSQVSRIINRLAWQET